MQKCEIKLNTRMNKVRDEFLKRRKPWKKIKDCWK